MSEMNADELKEVLRMHQLWLNNDPAGEMADLRGADLSGAGLLWNAAANALAAKDREIEQLRNGIDEALREAPDENSYSVYLDMVSVFRGEIEQLREECDAYNHRIDNLLFKIDQLEKYKEISYKRSIVLRDQLDEARRVARVWYNAAGVWKERYEANDVDAISDELMMYCQPRKVTIYPTGTASEVRNDEVKR